MRASGALGRAFLLLHKCFETEPQCLGPSFLTRDGMLRLCADYELAPLPRAATSVPRPGEQRDPHDPQGSGPLRSPFPRGAAPPRGQDSRQRPCASTAPATRLPPPPRPPALPDSPRAPAGQEATGRGAARRSPAQEEGCSPRRLQRRRRRPCCGAAAAALSRNSALPSPRLLPPNVGLLGKKVRLWLRNAKRGSAVPAPRRVSLCCCGRRACQVPARAGVQGAGPAQVEARLPAESAPSRLPRPHEHAQSAAAWGSEQWRGEGAGAKGRVALPGEERGGGSSRKGGSASAVSCGLLRSSINHLHYNEIINNNNL